MTSWTRTGDIPESDTLWSSLTPWEPTSNLPLPSLVSQCPPVLVPAASPIGAVCATRSRMEWRAHCAQMHLLWLTIVHEIPPLKERCRFVHKFLRYCRSKSAVAEREAVSSWRFASPETSQRWYSSVRAVEQIT